MRRMLLLVEVATCKLSQAIASGRKKQQAQASQEDATAIVRPHMHDATEERSVKKEAEKGIRKSLLALFPSDLRGFL